MARTSALLVPSPTPRELRSAGIGDLSGLKFSHWTVVSKADTINRQRQWICICDCGTERIVKQASLRSGASKSCGCIQKGNSTWTIEKDRASKKKHKDSIPNYRAIESKRWRDADPERAKERNRRTNYRTKYGMELEDVVALHASQGCKCAICGQETTLGGKLNAKVDHCHKTGKVRGILCHSCNIGIGFLADDISRMQKAIEYLKRTY